MRALLICGLLAGTAMAKEAAPDKASADLKAFADKMNDAFVKMDMTYIKGAISETPWGGSWDADMAGRPTAFATKADAVADIEKMSGMMKAMGAKMTFTPKMLDCKAAGTMGVCIQEGEMNVTSDKMPPMTMAFRETNVAMKEKGSWKWVHHHGSLAKWPETPAKSMAMTAKAAKWMEAPGMPGMQLSPIWMDNVHGQGVALMKVGAQGMKQAKHMHPYGNAFVVMEGSMTTTVDGKDTTYGPGSVVYRAPKEIHTTTLAPNSVFFAVMDGPMMSMDDKGQPVPMQPLQAAAAPEKK